MVGAALCLLLPACGGEQEPAADAGKDVSPQPSQTSTSSAVRDASPEPSPSATSTAEPRTTVPADVMLTRDLERTADRDEVEPWRAAYCPPGPDAPTAATAMRTRAWRGPAANPETGPLEYAQQVAAFPSVDAAVAAASRLVTAADSCGAAASAAGPRVSELPLGTQGRLVVFAEGGDYSIRGFFRRGNAIASVQGSGPSEAEVKRALNQAFVRLCIYERPDPC